MLSGMDILTHHIHHERTCCNMINHIRAFDSYQTLKTKRRLAE